MAEIGNHGIEEIPWPSLSAASKISDWANLLFIGSLVIGVVSTIMIVWMAGVKERHWDIARKQADLEIAGLQTEIAHANARALEAKLALEKYKAWRSLDHEAQTRISNLLKPFAGVSFDFSASPTAEPQALMMQIASALENAGWVWQTNKKAGGIALTTPGKPNSAINTGFVGLAAEIDVSKTDAWEPALVALIQAFAAEGLALRGNIANDGSATPDAIHIYVGVKQ
ncbi:MAG: hypothetical protein WDN02_13990 [Methylovirgula sp.]|uniref:hypothetical protein n=1 Tax=Methylovirgula sp. TaxID=1978224 RepID=UPI0030760727